MRRESSFFALASSSRRPAVRFFPARLIKKVSIRIPDEAPFGDTFFDANVLAMVAALLLNSPAGGWVESVLTFADHFFCVAFLAIIASFLTKVTRPIECKAPTA